MQGSLRSRGVWIGLAAGAVCVAPWPSRKLSEALGLEPKDEGHNYPELAIEESYLYEDGVHPTKRPARLVAYGTDFCGVYTDGKQRPLGWAAGLYRKHLLNTHGGCRAFVGTENGQAVLHEVPLPKDFPYKSVRVSAHYASTQHPGSDIEVDSMANVIHIAKGTRQGTSLVVLDTSGNKLSPQINLKQAATGRRYARVLYRLFEKLRPGRDRVVLRGITLPELHDVPAVGYVAQGPGKHITLPGAEEADRSPIDSAAFLIAEIPDSFIARLQLQPSTPTSVAVGRQFNSESPLPALRTTTGSQSVIDERGSTVEQLGSADAPQRATGTPSLPNKWTDSRSDLNSKFYFGIAQGGSAAPAGLWGQPQHDLVQKMITDTQTRRVLVGGAIHGDVGPGGKFFHSVPTAPGIAGMGLTEADCHPHTHQAVVSGARQRDYSDTPDWVAASTASGTATLLARRGNTALSVGTPEYLCTHARIALDLLDESHRDQIKKMYAPSALAAMSVCPVERKHVQAVIDGAQLSVAPVAQSAVTNALSK